jgi:hypothetical protein
LRRGAGERGRVWIQPEDGGLRVDAFGQQEQVSGAATDLEHAVPAGDPGRVEEAAVGGAGAQHPGEGFI